MPFPFLAFSLKVVVTRCSELLMAPHPRLCVGCSPGGLGLAQVVSGKQRPARLQQQAPPSVQVENEELRHLLWSSVLFYQTPGLEVTACVFLSTKAVYFVLHDGLRRYFSEPLQGRCQGKGPEVI